MFALLLSSLPVFALAQTTAPVEAPPEARASFFSTVTIIQALLSPDGEYIATLQRTATGETQLYIHATNGTSITRAEKIDLPENGVPLVIFFGGSSDTRLNIVANQPGKSSQLWRYDIGKQDFASALNAGEITAYANVSQRSQFAAPFVTFMSLKDAGKGRNYRVFANDGRFHPVTIVDGITPVTTLPDAGSAALGGGYLGFAYDDQGNQSWYYAHQQGARELARFTPLEVSMGAAPVSVYWRGEMGKVAFLTNSFSDTMALVEYDLVTGARTILYRAKADIEHVLLDPASKTPLAVRYEYARPHWHFLDKRLAAPALGKDGAERHARTISTDMAHRHWLIGDDDGGIDDRYLFYNGNTAVDVDLASQSNAADRPARAKVHPLVSQTTDGIELVSYLTEPAGQHSCSAARPCPLLVSVHGGPRTRNHWGYNPESQLFAARGYAVLNVNYRGSRGFGLKFENLGTGQWGGKMLDDVLFVTRQILQDPKYDAKKAGIFGGSYGGFIALNALSRDNSLFTCGAAIAATADLETFIRFHQKRADGLAQDLIENIGDPDKADALETMRQRSPLYAAVNIRAPILLIHGNKDVSTPFEDISHYSDRLRALGKPHSFFVFEEGAHYLMAGPERDEVYGLLETFFARCLGGKAQAVTRQQAIAAHDDLGLE